MESGNQFKVSSKVEDIAHMEVVTADENSTIEDALEIMADNNIRDVVFYHSEDESYHVFMAKDLFNYIRNETDYSYPIKDLKTNKLQSFNHDDNILDVYPEILPGNEYFGVLAADGELCGILSFTDITTSIDPNVLVERKSVGEVLSHAPVATVQASLSTADAFFYLDNVDATVLIYEHEELLGILTTKDMIHIIREKLDTSLPVSTYMTSPVQTVNMDKSIKDVLTYIREKGFKRAVVVDNQGKLLGAVTQRDLAGYAYSHWSDMIRSHTAELHELVGILEDKAMSFEKASLTDALTGIGNRNSFNNVIESEISRFYRYKTGVFSLLLLDIDHFKHVNDEYGHLIGDEVLVALAKILKSMIRDSDTVARWGGEEFVILLPITELDPATGLADRIRVKINETKFPTVGEVTISVGVSQYQEGESVQEFIKRTDEALYVARHLGRNRVQVAATVAIDI